MNILITICARGDSKGLPGKNIKPIGGVPLIGYSISCAQKFANSLPDHNVTIDLSTDSTEIVEVAKHLGLSTNYLRPADLATDTAGKIAVLEALLLYKEKQSNLTFDYLLDLDVSSPLRTLEDLNSAFDNIKTNSEALNLFSVNLAQKNPYFNMVELRDNQFAKLCKSLKSENIFSRQKAPQVFDMNASFYFYKRQFFTEENTSAITDRSLVYQMSHICFDVDSTIDFDFMEFLIENKKLGFDL